MVETDSLMEAAQRAGVAGGRPVEFTWQGRRWELRELPDQAQNNIRNWLFLILPPLLSLLAWGVYGLDGPGGSMIMTLVIGSGLAAVLLAVPGAFSVRRLVTVLVLYVFFALSTSRLLLNWSYQGSALLKTAAIATGVLLVPVLSGLTRQLRWPDYESLLQGLTATLIVGLAGMLAYGLLMLIVYLIGTLFSEAGVELFARADTPLMGFLFSVSMLGVTSALSRFMLTHDGSGLRVREGAFERLLRAIGTAYVVAVTPVLAIYLVFLVANGFSPILSTGRTTAIFGQLSLFGLIALSLMVGAADNAARERPTRWGKIAATVLIVELVVMNSVAFYALNVRMASAALTVTRLAGRLYQLLLFGWMVALVAVAAFRRSGLYGALRRVNRWGLLAALVLLIALCTNVINLPAIAAASQLDALVRGKIADERFDYYYLETLGRPALAPINRAIVRVPSAASDSLKQAKEHIQGQSPWEYVSRYYDD